MARGDTVAVDAVLAKPLVARVATNGPTIRPVWFLWEEEAMWWLTDLSSGLAKRLMAGDTLVAVVVDSCDLSTGDVVAVHMTGDAEVLDLDIDRAKRKFAKYLGPSESAWDRELLGSLELPTTRLVRLRPNRISGKDVSFNAG